MRRSIVGDVARGLLNYGRSCRARASQIREALTEDPYYHSEQCEEADHPDDH